MKYVVLLRGINVGGKNKLPMAQLRECLEQLGFTNVQTYIASGNVLLESNEQPTQIAATIERALPKQFSLDSSLIKVLVLSPRQLKSVVAGKPAGFGENPATYHSDAVFLIGIDVETALTVFSPKDGVDTIWPGKDVVYSQRVSALRTKSRLNKIIGTPAYQSMTIRNWNTVQKLVALLEQTSANR